MSKIIKEIIGLKFGKLLVNEISSIRGNNNQIRYKCYCDCGKIHETSGESLRSGKSKSCGCSKKLPHNKNNDRVNALLKHVYSSTVISRNRIFKIVTDIDFNHFVKLSFDNCYYCGSPPSNKYKDIRSGKLISNCVLIYNGLDRVDSSGGYTINNVVSCCKLCNTAKTDMKQNDFYNHIIKIYNFSKLNGNEKKE